MHLELETAQSGEVFLQFKRGRHKEVSGTHRVEVTPGGDVQQLTLKFHDEDHFMRVSDFYRNKGVVQDKKAKFQVMMKPDGQTKHIKISTTPVNVAQYVGKGTVTDTLKLNGSGKLLTFEILLEECEGQEKKGEASSDEEEV